MILKSTLRLTLLAAALSAAVVAQAQSPLTSPFGKASATAAADGMTKAQAKAALSSAVARKVEAKSLERFLDKDVTEFIVTFHETIPVAQSAIYSQKIEAEKIAFRTARRNVMASLNTTDVEMVREYSVLPMAFMRAKNRAALVKLLNHPGVKSVVENFPVKLATANSMPAIHQPAQVSEILGHTGAGTTVAVIDNGLNPAHPIFTGRIAATVAFPATETFTTDATGAHGTNVAGIAASVAPRTRIAALDVFNSAGGSTNAELTDALNWVIANKSTYNIVSVNMSLAFEDRGSFNSECSGAAGSLEAAYTTLISRLRAANIMPVIAAGNNKWKQGVTSPSCVPGAMSIGSVFDKSYESGETTSRTFRPGTIYECTEDMTKSLINAVPCYSNSGPRLTMFAPGSRISAGGYIADGTSQAAPHVAGAIAALRSALPNESLDQLQARLTKMDWKVTDNRDPAQVTVKPRLDLLGAIANNHYTVVQQLYLAYYGRPADANGLAYWAKSLADINAPTTLKGIDTAYGQNPTLKAYVDSFANSQESRDLYGSGTTQDFVKAVYRNAFSREGEAGGVSFWASAIDAGHVTRAQAAVTITSSAAGTDSTTVANKTAAMGMYTTSVDSAIEVSKYSGNSANALARGTIQKVNHLTNVPAFQATIDADLKHLVSTL